MGMLGFRNVLVGEGFPSSRASDTPLLLSDFEDEAGIWTLDYLGRWSSGPILLSFSELPFVSKTRRLL